MSDENFAYSDDEETGWAGNCGGREEALDEAIFEYGDDDEVAAVFTGRVVPLGLPNVGYADHIIEWLQSWLWDRIGEEGLGDWPEVPKGAVAELDAEFLAVFTAWLSEHGEVSFWANIEDVQRHELRGS